MLSVQEEKDGDKYNHKLWACLKDHWGYESESIIPHREYYSNGDEVWNGEDSKCEKEETDNV
jgi:hypothetical protein